MRSSLLIISPECDVRSSSRLALGTVQFGLRYGVANQSGQVGRDEMASILDHALSAGVDSLDTAVAYGESERRLGEIGVDRWQVISKLPPMPEDLADVDAWVQEMTRGSLQRLKVPRLRGLLLHKPQQLLGPKGMALYRALVSLKDQGKVQKIGVSIYDPEELDALCPRFRFDLVQAPFNILDRRLATSGWLARLHDAGTEIHVRSAFLQGLLLMGPETRPAAFGRWQALWDRWHRWLDERSVTPLQACLGFALSIPEISRVVVGIDNLGQLQDILAGAETPHNEMPPQTLSSSDSDLINPSRWQKS